MVIVFVAFGVTNDGDFGKIISEIKFANYREETDLHLDDINGKKMLASLVLKRPLFEVFPSVAIYPLLGLISCNVTTCCLAVTDGGSVGECGRLSQPSLVILTYLLTHMGVNYGRVMGTPRIWSGGP